MKKILLLVFIALSVGCKKKEPAAPEIPQPGKASLIFPAQNTLCEAGAVASATTTNITFSWKAGENTDSYELIIKNLVSRTSMTINTTSTQASVVLERNNPYSWMVKSKSTKTTATPQTDIFKFYVSGIGTKSYSPFPATLISPGFANVISAGNANIRLEWSGADVDNDISSYSLYFGTSPTPGLVADNITSSFYVTPIGATANTYYWKVVTKDMQGNSSDSEVFRFDVK